MTQAWRCLAYFMSFLVAHLSLRISPCLFLSVVFLCDDCFPVVVVLASVLQHGLTPRDIEEMLEVRYVVT